MLRIIFFLITVWISSLVRCLFKSLTFFLIIFWLMIFGSCLYILDPSTLPDMCFTIFFSSLWLLPPIFKQCFTRKFCFKKSQLGNVYFMDCVFFILNLNTHWQSQGYQHFLTLYSRSVIVLHFIILSIINFELIFM